MSEAPWDLKRYEDPMPSNELGSLAQNARGDSLRQARIILGILGTLNVAVNLVVFFLIDSEIEQAQRQGLRVNEDLVRLARLLSLGGVALGVLFIVLGVAVYKAPLLCTVTGLVLYLGLTAVALVMNPEAMLNPCTIIIRVLIIVGLVKAVQTATSYERESRAIAQRSRDSEFE